MLDGGPVLVVIPVLILETLCRVERLIVFGDLVCLGSSTC